MVIIYSPKFKRVFKKLPQKQKIKVIEKIELMKNIPFSDQLKIHKLKGMDNFSLWVEYDFRILFKIKKNEIRLITLGDHNSVY